jgi:hypothetical protein
MHDARLRTHGIAWKMGIGLLVGLWQFRGAILCDTI